MTYSSSGRSPKNTYFRQLPNLDYPSLANDRTSAYDYNQVKNIFKRAVLREDVVNSYFQFNQYLIEGDDRPDNVASKVYGDANLDWVVLTTNNVINVRDEWPMSQNDLQNYLTNKYTTAELSYVHHYETLKIVDSSQKLIQPKGITVEEGHSITFVDRGVSRTESTSIYKMTSTSSKLARVPKTLTRKRNGGRFLMTFSLPGITSVN